MATVLSVRWTRPGRSLPFVIAVDEHGDAERPDAGDGAGLDGGENAEQNAGNDDENRNQAPQCFEADHDGFAERHRFALRVAVPIADEDDQGDQ